LTNDKNASAAVLPNLKAAFYLMIFITKKKKTSEKAINQYPTQNIREF